MERIAQVCINLPTQTIHKVFSYHIPAEFAYVDVGWRVLVGFGSRRLEGFIVEVGEQADGSGDYEIKPIADVLDDEPWFDENMLQTAYWLSDYYLCSLAEAMRLFIPGKSGLTKEKGYRLADGLEAGQLIEQAAALSELHGQVAAYLSLNGFTGVNKLKRQFGAAVTVILAELYKRKWLLRMDDPKKKAQAKYETVVKPLLSEGELPAALGSLKNKPAQQRLLEELVSSGGMKLAALAVQGFTRDTATRLVKAGLAELDYVQVVRDSYQQDYARPASVQLTPEQHAALAAIQEPLAKQAYQTFLLHGITGSGKTEVYMEAAAAVRRAERQVIVLVPEIALTGQLVARFKARFGDDVVVVHSKLAIGERHDAWQRVKNGSAGIVIGARSAVFAPVRALGLVILDEEHEFTYKQEEAPRYHTRETAVFRAQTAGAVVLLGSATPSIESYYRAAAGQYKLLTMTKRIDGSTLPAVEVVDMRAELKAGRRSVISTSLQTLLTDTLAKREQAIILLNRRGHSTFVLCRECGYIVRCQRCSVSMVYHQTSNSLRCHYCQETQAAPDVCPSCLSRYIKYFGTGTQKLEQELSTLFPAARIIRMDQDSTSGKLAHDRILGAFAQGEYDILLGTQMVAKGHDIKNVTAVGIIAADAALNLPDFRSSERAFSLLTQAAGRAGRGEKSGRVVVQTYNPEHYAMTAGAAHDYQAFYTEEIAGRRMLGYPPFNDLIKLTVAGTDEAQTRRKAEEIAAWLRADLPKTAGAELIGPFTAPLAKINNVFRVAMLIKARQLPPVKAVLAARQLNSRSDVTIDVDPIQAL